MFLESKWEMRVWMLLTFCKESKLTKTKKFMWRMRRPQCLQLFSCSSQTKKHVKYPIYPLEPRAQKLSLASLLEKLQLKNMWSMDSCSSLQKKKASVHLHQNPFSEVSPVDILPWSLAWVEGLGQNSKCLDQSRRIVSESVLCAWKLWQGEWSEHSKRTEC